MNVKYFVLSCALSCGVDTLSLCDMCCNKRTYNILIYGENKHVFWVFDNFVCISVDYYHTKYDKYTQEKVLSVSPVDFHGQSCKHNYGETKCNGMKIRLWAVMGDVDLTIFDQVGGLDGVFVFFDETEDYNNVFDKMKSIVSNGRITKRFFCHQSLQIGQGGDKAKAAMSAELQVRIEEAYKDAFNLGTAENLSFSSFCYYIEAPLWFFMESIKENAQKSLKS
ncbi:MAG: hypothetical protein II393_04525 [Cytophagales bacterium]|nr:hypothetical protein [Cytophagales bacterium]